MRTIDIDRIMALADSSKVNFDTVQYPANGEPALHERLALVILLYFVQAHNVFEFGTFTGNTTKFLTDNLPPDGRMYTLDLETTDGIQWQNEDKIYAQQSLRERPTFDDPRIVQLLDDSLYFEPEARGLCGIINFVWIDGNHHIDYLRKDTENAFKMLDPERPGCIAWHDYSRKGYEPLTEYLDNLSLEKDLFFIYFDDQLSNSTTVIHLSQMPEGLKA